MLRTLLIADDQEAIELLSSVIRSTGELSLECVVPLRPGSYQLSAALQRQGLDAIVLEATDADTAFRTFEHIREKIASAPVVTFSLKHRTMQTPFPLELPLSAPSLMQTIRLAFDGIRTQPEQGITVMLPAKGGSGATTVAINTAARMADASGRRVVVCEADLNSGVIADLLGLQTKQSIQQTLVSADSIEGVIWPRHICHKDGVDFVLRRCDHTGFQARWHQYHHLLSFLSKRYDEIVFDLPEVIDDALSYVVQRAGQVYLVTTPDIAALHLTQQRIGELRAMGVATRVLRVILNGQRSGDVSPRDIEHIIGCPVEQAMPQDEIALRAAAAAQTFVEKRTALGRAYAQLVSMMADRPGQTTTSNRSLFRFFTPARAYARAQRVAASVP